MNFDLAPPPRAVDGLLAVPVDISHIDAALVFDAATSSASGDATLTFTVGPTAGSPLFDLRQTITAAWLDGAPVAVSQMASHDFGGGANAQLRVLAPVLAAGSAHTLRVTYTVGTPDAPGAFTPVWSAGPRLLFRFHMSDLNPGRYLEQWIPSNLPFDQFSLALDLRINGTAVAHSLLTNGTAASLGTNHWSVAFPARFTTVSPFLELRASDTVESSSGTVTLPLSGTAVTIELWKLAAAPVDLAAARANIASWLSENETNYGPYLHGSRFVAFLNDGGGGMEYDGATTSSGDDFVLRHETFHSWFARGVKPALQIHGWLDEGWTSYHDYGANGALAFDFAASPVTLCNFGNPWLRRTPGNSYEQGQRLFEGIAALATPAELRSWMRELYRDYRDRPSTTADLEGLLVARSGNTEVVRAFDRFVYGFAGLPAPAPNLWLRDESGDPGGDSWGGSFWNSPDVWVRNEPDDDTTHEPPRADRDNYFYARVRNAATAGTARHFVVTFAAKSFAGTEFVYPDDFLPAINAAVAYDLAPGESRIVRARWPRALVPAEGVKVCLLAAALTSGDFPAAGRHVWEHNNLAQKNVVVAEAAAGEFIAFSFVLRGGFGEAIDRGALTVRSSRELKAELLVLPRKRLQVEPLDDGCPIARRAAAPAATFWSSRAGDSRAAREFAEAEAIALPPTRPTDKFRFWKRGVPVHVAPGETRLVALRMEVPRDAKPGEVIHADLVKRARDGSLAGGIAVEIHVERERS